MGSDYFEMGALEQFGVFVQFLEKGDQDTMGVEDGDGIGCALDDGEVRH